MMNIMKSLWLGIDVYTVPELEEVLMPMRQGTHDIHVNVTNVSYMDSTGLGLFVEH